MNVSLVLSGTGTTKVAGTNDIVSRRRYVEMTPVTRSAPIDTAKYCKYPPETRRLTTWLHTHSRRKTDVSRKKAQTEREAIRLLLVRIGGRKMGELGITWTSKRSHCRKWLYRKNGGKRSKTAILDDLCCERLIVDTPGKLVARGGGGGGGARVGKRCGPVV
jgi:hypothetical protein